MAIGEYSRYVIMPCFFGHDTLSQQEIRANAHETRDSIRWYWSISSNFGVNSLFKCVSQPTIAKNSLKTLFFGFKVVQGRRCWYPRKGRQHVMISSKSLSICNRCHARLVDSSRNRAFLRGYANLMHSYGLLEHRGGGGNIYC